MNRRLRLLITGVVLSWCIIGSRLIYLQCWQHADFALQAHRQQRYVETIPARPGDILDRRGRLLATTVKVHSLYVDPSRIDDPQTTAASLAEVLKLDAEALAEHLTSHRDRQFLWVKRRLSSEEVDRLLELQLPSSICGLREEFRRRYPHRHLAAHLLGWRGIDGAGQEGIERTLDARLSGTDGHRTLVRDARGYVLDILEEVASPPVHGPVLRLTIDLDLQAFVEDRSDQLMDDWHAQAASIVVLDPRNGDVLAMASRPTFDPNAPADSPPENWVNQAISRSFEPGSTLKPAIVAWAIQNAVVNPTDQFDCGQGTYQMGTRTLHDAHPHGLLDVSGILVKSSNIGMAQIGERLGNDRLFAAVQAFGFGRSTGIELPGESRGLVRPLERWDRYSTGSIPMGQELAVTPLQIACAHATLANGGRLISPHLVATDNERTSFASHVVATRVIDQATAEWIVRGPLRDVVTTGTARRAAIAGVAVFAKTGTAQVYDNLAGGYSTDRYVSSCVCGGPAENPTAIVLVTLSEPQADIEPFGGTVAAPAASEILRRALEIQSASTTEPPYHAPLLHDSPSRAATHGENRRQ